MNSTISLLPTRIPVHFKPVAWQVANVSTTRLIVNGQEISRVAPPQAEAPRRLEIRNRNRDIAAPGLPVRFGPQ